MTMVDVELPRPNDPLMRQTLQVVEDFFATYGCTPTVREVADELGVASKATAQTRLDRLVRADYLRRRGGRLCLVNWRASS